MATWYPASGIQAPVMSPYNVQCHPPPIPHDPYLVELLQERQKLIPFASVLPNCARLINQEISRVSALVGSPSYHDGEVIITQQPSLIGPYINPNHPMAPSNHFSSPGNPQTPPDLTSWNPMKSEPDTPVQRVLPISGTASAVKTSPGSHLLQKQTKRIDLSEEQRSQQSLVGRILGPRGNSLKRIEDQTGCRVLIRGKGSIKDPAKEEQMKLKPGYEHLNDPLHIIIEAELPSNIVDDRVKDASQIILDLLEPHDNNSDPVKREQLRELALINRAIREETPPLARGASPFSNQEMKRAKTTR